MEKNLGSLSQERKSKKAGAFMPAFQPQEGASVLPTEPGLSIAPDEEALADVAYLKPVMGATCPVTAYPATAGEDGPCRP